MLSTCNLSRPAPQPVVMRAHALVKWPEERSERRAGLAGVPVDRACAGELWRVFRKDDTCVLKRLSAQWYTERKRERLMGLADGLG